MVFQEPMTSLNPVLSIGRQLTEAMRAHLGLTPAAARDRAVELLDLVGIAEPQRRLKQYPHHLSGGMRQRVMIAMALACKPELIVADEPTTALDVTIQAQILELMQGLCRRMGVALVIITHNLGIVARHADRVNVMYAAAWWNTGGGGDLSPPQPSLHGRPAELGAAAGPAARRAAGPDPRQPRPTRWRFRRVAPSSRACALATALCAQEVPTLRDAGQGHQSACFEIEALHAMEPA